MRVYLTVLTTDDYAVGALALYQSLREIIPPHKYDFVIVLTKDVSDGCEVLIRNSGISTIRIDKHLERLSVSPKRTNKQGFLHWNNTISKLLIFDLTQYDKIVYLDSDMIVLRNLDDLFEKPHMSAVVADVLMPGHEAWVQLSSGLMVIEPEAGLSFTIMAQAKDVDSKKYLYSDQDILQEHFADWPKHPELHLDQTYNILLRSVDIYKGSRI